MTDELDQDLHQLATKIQPATVLIIGPDGASGIDRYCAERPDCTLTRLDCAEIDTGTTLGRYDLVLVHAVLEHLDKTRAGQLLARLRDLHARHLLVLVPMSEPPLAGESHWTQADLLGLGMVRVGRYHENRGTQALYRFEIESYKTTPDWLNARYWAHPERWDKDWW